MIPSQVSSYPKSHISAKSVFYSVLLAIGGLLVLAILVWQAVTAHGNPDPTGHGLSRSSIILSSGVLVFREGLEAILVLAAVTAGLKRYKSNFWPPVLIGVGAALISTVITWFVAIAIISDVNAPELAIQAGTGLLAIIVLLVVMNWFFHKIYWTGWIGHHSKRRKKIFEESNATALKISFGLALLGFTAIYREGFEVVLFLQDLRLKAGSSVVLSGALLGVILSLIVAILTFSLHYRLPYKKMLILTGGLLAGVLVVMVGESAQEMQQAGWLSSHAISLPIPDWMGVWFAMFPNIEGLVAQVLAIALVVGSYLWVRNTVPKAKDSQQPVVS